MPNSASHDGIEEIVMDENEGINVFASTSDDVENAGASQTNNEVKRFISLSDIKSENELDSLSVKQLKEILMLNRVDFRGCCEKDELKERVRRLFLSHKAAPRK